MLNEEADRLCNAQRYEHTDSRKDNRPEMTPGTFWSGLIDDVRIYDRALSPEQVETLAR